MNGPEILQLIRHDLQRAVARRGEPPIPRPARRLTLAGDERLAEGRPARARRPRDSARRRPCCATRRTTSGGGSAASPSRTSGWRAWRPSGSRRRRWRESKLAPRWAANGRSPICRLRTLPSSEVPGRRRSHGVCELHPAHAEARVELPRMTTRDLIAVATGQGPSESGRWRYGLLSEQIDGTRPS